MWENKRNYNGLSVLPYSDHSYKQAPFEDCTKEEYESLLPYNSGFKRKDIIEAIISAEIPVMGHLGLTPQSKNMMGGYKVQGKTLELATELLEEAVLLESIGCFSIDSLLDFMKGPPEPSLLCLQSSRNSLAKLPDWILSRISLIASFVVSVITFGPLK